MTLRFTPARLALSYIALGVLALALLAVPLWYGFQANLGTFRAYVPGAEMQRFVEVFHREGPQAVAAAMDAYAARLPPGEVAVFADPRKQRLAGNLPRWPTEVPDAPGTYGLVIGLGDEASMRVVSSHVVLPGGYQLLMGRESVRFDSLVARFWYGIAGAVAIVLTLSVMFGWLLRRVHRQLEGLVEQRTAELRTSEERYERAMLAAEAGFWDWDVLADEFYISPKLLEMSNNAPGSKFAGRSDWVARTPIHPDDLAKWERAVKELFASDDTRLAMEVRTIRGSETRWVFLSGLCVRDGDGKILRWTGSATDVTARKRAEMALRQSDERYVLAVAGSNDGLWDWDILTNEMFLSERAQRIYGLEPGQAVRPRAEWRALVKIHPDDAEGQLRSVEDYLAGKSTSYEGEWRVLHPDGHYRWIRIRGACVRDAQARPTRFAGSVSDIDVRRRAEEALRRTESYLTEALRLGRAGSFAYDARAHRNVHWSPMTYEIFDFDPAAGLPLPEEIYRRLHPQDVERVREARRKAMQEKADYDAHYRIVRRDGTTRHLHATGHPVLDANGEVTELVGVVTDVTESKRAEQALRLSEERYARAMEGSDAGHWDWNIVTDEMFLSERAREMLALPPGPLPARRAELMALVPQHPDDAASMHVHVTSSIASGSHERDYRIVPRAGEVRWLRSRGKVYKDARGAAVRMTGSLIDITERKLAGDALRASEQRYGLAMEASAEGHFDWDVRTDEIFVSAHIKKVFGFPLDAEFRTRSDLIAHIPYHPDDARWLPVMVRDTLAGSALAHEFEYRIVREGATRWLQTRWKLFRGSAGKAERVIGVVTDITDRKRAADELAESEARWRALTELSSDWYWRQDEDLRFTYVSHQVADSGRYPREWVIGKTRWQLPGVTPLSTGWDEHRAVLAARQPFREFEYTRIGRNGEIEYVSVSGAPIFDEQGNFRGYQGVGRSITERRRAEEELKAMERKLRQAQHLEAMGTLAGGIAHDFNNILGAILGYGEMAMRDAPKGSRLARDLDSIVTAGERGRALVDRVLAFSRSGVGERVPVHVEKVVREALDLISAKLPPDITLHAKLHAPMAAMQGDATQVHQVLMNLATNAIQAMPAGGTLRVSLEALRLDGQRVPTIGTLADGDYLVLRVADTGIGIAPAIMERVFDPFFTTKEVGTGTGLGLSLVHGIVTELGGAIDVTSSVGAGTTFTIYLPRSGEASESEEHAELKLPRGDGQRVLVIDDEEPLVHLATRTLQDLGYVPVGFTSSSAALAAFRADPERFDAVITDERMPGMSGSSLIREVRGIRDRIPIVLMSGYVGAALATRAREAGAEEVLKKPLSARDLAASLARVLHQ